jgi:DNA polymerase III subunit delta'
VFEDFIGNKVVCDALTKIVEQDRIPHTLLFHGPQGVGKATLARRFAAVLVGGAEKIEQDDLSLVDNRERIAEREKLPSEKRAEDPLVFATHSDFVTFPPDGPLRQLSIQQMRLLKERAQFLALKGDKRVFLIDHLDRANENAANSLLKTLEEPPDHMVLIATAENVYDLLPTIRSRAIQFHFSTLSLEEMQVFVGPRELDEPGRRVALANGSPGVAVRLDLEEHDRHRTAMLALLGAATKTSKFSAWGTHAEKLAADRTTKLDVYLMMLYSLLEDMVHIQNGEDRIRNADVRDSLVPLAEAVRFEWMRAAVRRVDELIRMSRRSIQKSIALDALVLELRDKAAAR